MEHYVFQVNVCQQCHTQECVTACPSDALYVDAYGIVVLNDNECTKCGACADACPHDGIFFNSYYDKYLKCDMCTGRNGGPLCTTLCPTGALVLEDY
ncbi:4Fe-4S dicluster domain-containing protein [Chloroflexota bacterium]